MQSTKVVLTQTLASKTGSPQGVHHTKFEKDELQIVGVGPTLEHAHRTQATCQIQAC